MGIPVEFAVGQEDVFGFLLGVCGCWGKQQGICWMHEGTRYPLSALWDGRCKGMAGSSLNSAQQLEQGFLLFSRKIFKAT